MRVLITGSSGRLGEPLANSLTPAHIIFGIFRRHGWSLPTSIDRVYVTDKAEAALGYNPQYNFTEMLAQMA